VKAIFWERRHSRGKVLIVQADEPQHSTKSRLLKRGFRREDAANVQYINQFNISQLFKLEEKLEEFRPSLVIIDSLRRINAGREISENSAEFADQIYELKELLTRYGASGIIIHHANKNPDATGIQRSRGSSSIPGAVWGIWDFSAFLKLE
jgi:predicted ATP-dependent serine protease